MHADAVLRTYCMVDVYPVSTLSATVRNVLTKRDSVTTTQKRIQEERWFKTKIQYSTCTLVELYHWTGYVCLRRLSNSMLHFQIDRLLILHRNSEECSPLSIVLVVMPSRRSRTRHS